MSAEENKAFLNHWVAEVWNKGNLALADEVISEDYVYHDPSLPAPIRGKDGFKGLVAMYRTAIPDLTLTVDDAIAEGDKVAWRYTGRGTQTGPLMGFPPSGNRAEVTGTIISRFANGKWVEDYSNQDTLGMLQQMGIIPKMGS
jgi:steroid delta-isomerase-like uncharacterized protein